LLPQRQLHAHRLQQTRLKRLRRRRITKLQGTVTKAITAK